MISEENTRCRCCKCCPGLQTIIKLKNTGLALCRHTSPAKIAGHESDVLYKTNNVHNNTSNFEINKDEYISQFAQYKMIKCSRCKYYFEHVRELLGKKPLINKFEVFGICKYCLNIYKKMIPCICCCECVNNFIANKKQMTEEETKELVMLKRLQTYFKITRISKKMKLRSLSADFLNKILDIAPRLLYTPRVERLPHDNLHRISSHTNARPKSPCFLESIDLNDSDSIHKKRCISSVNIYGKGKSHFNSDALDLEFKMYTPSFNQTDDKDGDLSNFSDFLRSTKVVKSFTSYKTNRINTPANSSVEEPICKDFNFFFIKKNKKNIQDIHKTSSELIVGMQNMVKEQEKKEFEKKKKHLENKKKAVTSEIKICSQNNITEMYDKKEIIPTGKKFLPKESVKLLKEKALGIGKQKAVEDKTRAESAKDNEKEYKKDLLKREDRENGIRKEKISEKEQNIIGILEKLSPRQVEHVNNRNKKSKQLKSGNGKMEKESNIDELQKMLSEQKKQKDEELIMKKIKDQKKSKRIISEAIEDEDKHQIKLKPKEKNMSSKKHEIKRKMENKTEQKTNDELKINQIVGRNTSTDDLILKLIKLKQSETPKPRVRPKRLSEINISPHLIADYNNHKYNKRPKCIIYNDSELERDIENIVTSKTESKDEGGIIMGQKLIKYKPIQQTPEDEQIAPKLFKTTFEVGALNIPMLEAQGKVEEKNIFPKRAVQEIPKGIIRYALSDRTFIDKGWTMLPTEKVVRKINVYRMRPAHPEFDWFKHNKNKKLIHYDTGEKLAEIEDSGKGRWFYRNGKLALDYYDAEEKNAQNRFVIYSSGEPDERGRSRPVVILATFDYLGNGIVFDHAGRIRLKYNQTEGVILDKSIGPVSHWKWHTLNDPPVLQQIMIDTQMAHKNSEIYMLGGPGEEKTKADNEEMLAIEFDNFIKEKSKKLSQKFKPFQIKMKALKINEHFSLKVLDQATVYLIFRDGSTNLKINIGMILDNREIVDTDTAEVGEVSNSIERFPAQTDSLAGLQKSLARAQRIERARLERERRLRPVKPCASFDQIHSALSRPLQPSFRTVPSTSITASTQYNFKCRKLKPCNSYYDTNLL